MLWEVAMIKTAQRIKAVFENYENFIGAVKDLAKEKNLTEVEIFSPMPLHDVEKYFPQKPSKVRWFTFVGGILGMAVGFGFPIYTVLQWPIITGGKPVVTIQTFIIIAFELLILFGAIFTLIGLLFTAKLPRQALRDYDERFSTNHFGIVVKSLQKNNEKIVSILKNADDLVIDEVEIEL